MKKKIVQLISVCFTAFLSSCLGSDNDYIYETTNNCQLLSFSLDNDSVSGLDDVSFTIDQLTNTIFNLDSMPLGTEVDSVLPTLTYASAVTGVYIYQSATGDTVEYSSSDTINISEPIKILLYSSGVLARSYDAWINVHTQEPDSMTWKLYSENLLTQTMSDIKVITNQFYSEDEDTYMMYARPTVSQTYLLYTAPMDDPDAWTEQQLTGLPSSGLILGQITTFQSRLYIPSSDGTVYVSEDGVSWETLEGIPTTKALLGGLTNSVNQPPALSAIIEEDGILSFAAMDTTNVWTIGASVPDEFPLSGFAAANLDVMYRNRLFVVGGRTSDNQLVNTTWSTMDALTWANLTDSESDYFEKKEGASVAYYDDKFYLIGGINESGQPTKDIHLSIDKGVTWSYIDSLVVLPDDYNARGFASMLVDDENYLCIFGGKTASLASILNEIWRGRVNRLGFERQ